MLWSIYIKSMFVTDLYSRMFASCNYSKIGNWQRCFSPLTLHWQVHLIYSIWAHLFDQHLVVRFVHCCYIQGCCMHMFGWHVQVLHWNFNNTNHFNELNDKLAVTLNLSSETVFIFTQQSPVIRANKGQRTNRTRLTTTKTYVPNCYYQFNVCLARSVQLHNSHYFKWLETLISDIKYSNEKYYVMSSTSRQ